MPGPRNHEEALAWLETARRLLKTNLILSNTRSRMHSDLAALETHLASVRDDIPTASGEYEQRYNEISSAAHAIEEGEGQLADKRAALEAVAGQLKVLRADIAALLAAKALYEQRKAATSAHIEALRLQNREGTTYEQPLVDAQQQAQTDADAARFADAAAKLSDINALAKTQRDLAETTRANAVDDVRHKPVYDDKRARIQAVIAELEPLPGTSEATTGLRALLTKGEGVAASGKYEDAYKALKGLTALRKKGRKAAADFPAQAGDAKFQEARAAARAALDAYTSRFALAEPDAVTGHEATYTSLLKDLEKEKRPDSNAIQTATAKMTELAEKLAARTTESKRNYEECDQLAKDCEELIEEVQLYCTPKDFGPLLKKHRHAQGLMSILDFAKAKAAYGKLKADLVKASADHKPAYTEWKTTQAEVLQGPISSLDAIRADWVSSYFADLENYYEGKAPDPSELYLRYRTAETEVVTSHAYADATKVAKAVLRAVDTPGGVFSLRIKAIQDNKANIDEAEQVLSAARERAERKIEALDEAGGDIGPFRSQLQGIREKWFTATITNVLAGQALKAARDQATAAYKAIEEEIVSILGDGADTAADPAKLDASKAAAATAKVVAAFDLAMGVAHSKLEGVTRGEFQPSIKVQERRAALALLRKQRKAALQKDICTGTPNDWPRHKAFTTILARAQSQAAPLEQLAEERTRDRDTARLEVKTAVAQARGRIKALLKARKRFKPYLLTVQRQIEDLSTMATSEVPAVVEQARDAFKTTGTMGMLLDKLEEAATFDRILEKKSAAKRLLEDADFKEVRPDLVAAWTKRYQKQVKPEMAKLPPAKAYELVDQFHQDVEADKNDASAAKAARARIEATRAQATAELKKLQGAPELKKDLTAQIETLKDFTPGCETSYEIQIKALLHTLGVITAPTGAADKLQMEKVVRQRALEAEKRESSLLASIDVFDKNLMRQAKARLDDTPKGLVDTQRYQAISTARNEASAHQKKGLIAEAEDKLAEATQLARAFIADPFDPTASRHRKLQAAQKAYQAAVHAFGREVNALAAEISTAAEEDQAYAASGAVATRPFERLPTLFDVNKFNDSLATLSKNPSLPELRLAKEQVLSFVRTYQDRFDRDPVLKLLGDGTPFQGQVALTPIKTALAQIEVSVLRLG